jgi:hypothetical protein
VANSKKTVAKKNKTTRKAPAKAESAAGAAKKSAPAAGSDVATLNRRAAGDRRSTADRRKKSQPVAVERRTTERRAKVNRRRQIDPTTCERDYSNEEIEFMNAVEEYKRSSGRMFPTCSEILEVLLKLGYQKLPAEPTGELPPVEPEVIASADGPQIVAEDRAAFLIHESAIA